MLSPDTLYLGDNGRLTCGALRCAGASAHFGGVDVSGQPVEPLTARESIAHNFRCEGCGMQPSLVVAA